MINLLYQPPYICLVIFVLCIRHQLWLHKQALKHWLLQMLFWGDIIIYYSAVCNVISVLLIWNWLACPRSWMCLLTAGAILCFLWPAILHANTFLFATVVSVFLVMIGRLQIRPCNSGNYITLISVLSAQDVHYSNSIPSSISFDR